MPKQAKYCSKSEFLKFIPKSIKIRTRKGTKSMKKTMTRILTLALALAMSATMVACNNGGQTSSGSDSSAAESANESAAENNGEEITITYAFWGSEDDISEDSVAKTFFLPRTTGSM